MKTKQVLFKKDDPFLFEVYASSRQEEVSLWGWTDEQRLQFLHMQFHCQQRSYQLQYPHLEIKIILLDSIAVGRILTDMTSPEIVIVDITLLSQFRNKGIGTALLTELQEEAATVGKSIRLSVFRDNPARRFYQRLGFQPVGGDQLYTIMRWNLINVGVNL